MARKRGWLFFLLGLLLLVAYWYSVRPLGLGRLYVEDWCQPDMSRQIMAESLAKHGKPNFYSEQYRAPFGTSVAYMSWGIEQSWLGAIVWKLSRDFPFSWAYFGLSMLVAYVGVGLILGRMLASRATAWMLAALVVVFHVPRHFKIWHHYEHLLQHWVYLGFFVDAWIWHRFWRERKWSLGFEAWRAWLALAMMGTAGYFWGPMILEWVLVRSCMVALARSRLRPSGVPIQVELDYKRAAWPALLALPLLVIDLQWFMPLQAEATRLGTVDQGLGWFTPLPYLLRPLWLDSAITAFNSVAGTAWSIRSITRSETVVTLGWFLWIPVVLGWLRVSRRKGGVGLHAVLPFLILLTLAVIYVCVEPPVVQRFLQSVIPFMKFFRVASRWGLFLPQLLVVMLVLCWPELSAWARVAWARRSRAAMAWLGAFAALSLVELSVMLTPVSVLPDLSASAGELLEGVRTSPGTSVLDLPFCHAGGNGVCSNEQCPIYPGSTVGGCFRLWHDKSVYGIYEARLVGEQCQPYRQMPFVQWFSAWREQRCFTEGEWGDFCQYLDEHAELSAVLLYPDMWTGAGQPECMAQFERRLGKPVAEASFVAAAIRGKEQPRFSRVMRFGTRCLR